MHAVHMTATRRFPLKTPTGAKRLDTSIDHVTSVNMGQNSKGVILSQLFGVVHVNLHATLAWWT